MQIDWQHFTPWASLAGGVLIGLAASLLLLANGRIAGISGIVGGLLQRPDGDTRWRAAFVAGLLLAPVLWTLLLPGGLPAPRLELTTPTGWGLVVLGGVLVGFGARLAKGCTSGHGICGLARLSPRSLVAVGVFMSSGFATVFTLRHLVGD